MNSNTKVTINQLKGTYSEVPDSIQKELVGGISVDELLMAIMRNIDCYAGMTFNVENGDVVTMTSTSGSTYIIPSSATIADLESAGGSTDPSNWLDRSNGLDTNKFPILNGGAGGTVTSNRVMNGDVRAYWSLNGASYGVVGYYNNVTVHIENFVSEGAAFTLPGIGIYVNATYWNSLSHDEQIQLLAHEYGHQYTYDFLENVGGPGYARSQYLQLSAESVTSALDWTGDGNHMHTPSEVLANYFGWINMGRPPVWTGGGTVPHGYWDPYYYFPGIPGLPEN